MKLLLIGLLIASTANAGTIVPNIKWNNIETNNTGSAAALNQRNNATVGIATFKINDEVADTNSYNSYYMGQVMKGFDNWMVEASVLEFNNDSSYTDQLAANVGYLIMPELSVGADLSHMKYDGGEQNSFGVSSTKVMSNGLAFGGGVRTQTTLADENRESIYAGIGFISSNTTVAEAVLSYTPQNNIRKDSATYIYDEEVELALNATHTMGKFQVFGSLVITSESNDDSDVNTDTESSATDLTVGGEYMLTKQLALGASLNTERREDIDNEDSTDDEDYSYDSISLSARYQFSKFQVYAAYSKVDTETDYADNSKEDEEDTSDNFAVFGTYFF